MLEFYLRRLADLGTLALKTHPGMCELMEAVLFLEQFFPA